MSIKVMTYVWEHSKRKGTSLLIELALADFANDDGECYPGTRRLAKKGRVSAVTLHKYLALMESEKAVGIVRKRGINTNGGVTSRYYLNEYRAAHNLAPVETATHTGHPVNTGLQRVVNPSLQPVVNTGLQRVVNTGLQNPSVEPSGKPSVKDSVPAAQDASPAKPKAVPAVIMNPLKDAIVLAMGWQWTTMTKAEKGMVQTAAKSFAEASAVPEDVTACKAECDRREWKNYGPVALTKVLSDVRKAAPAASSGTSENQAAPAPRRRFYANDAWIAAERLSPDGTIDGHYRPEYQITEIPAAGTYGGIVLEAGEKVYQDGTLPFEWMYPDEKQVMP